MTATAPLCSFAAGLALACQAGEFVNLDFDSPDVSHAQYNPYTHETLVLPEEALRGWSMQWDWTGPPLPMPQSVDTAYGDAPIGLIREANPGGYFGTYQLTVEETWSSPYTASFRPTFHLYQVGLVPEGASELDFYVTTTPLPIGGGDPMRLYINGMLQSYSGPSYYRTVDVSAFAGHEVKLEFVFPGGLFHSYLFDINGFVPEPSVWALLGVGGLALWALRRRK